MYVGYHGHASTGPAEYAVPFASARFNAANVDIGHYIAGNHGSPLPFLIEHASRITHLHIKDRLRNEGPNVPFGQGHTPIREVLQLMRDRKLTFQATIEFEYPIPEGSTRMAEIARAIAYCRECLLA
jgi:sugar phosphate isomerase/epimerase